MSGTRITMRGADGQHYGSATGLQSRLIQFQDMTRHFTLNNWEWEVFDTYPYQDDLIEAAYLHALEFWFLDEFTAASTGSDVPGPSMAGPTTNLRTPDRSAPKGGRFETQLRRSFKAMIRVNMARAAGFPEDPSNQF